MDKIVVALICAVLYIIHLIKKVTQLSVNINLPTKLVPGSKPSTKTLQVWGFPASTSAKDATRLLEQHAGEKSVYHMRPKPDRRRGSFNTKCYAVQFTSPRDVERILRLAKKRRLQCGPEWLEAQPMERDLVARPSILESVDDVTLHFGCQVSFTKLLKLWSGENSSLGFDFGNKKVYFFLHYDVKRYKLELPCENISQIHLRRPPSTLTKFLVIEWSGRPLVYKKGETHQESEDIYLQEAQDDHWIRTVDFTPTNCIGQSSVLCVELPISLRLPDLKANFPHLKDHKSQFALAIGAPFSQDSELVPIIDSPKEVDLPFDLLFMVNILVQKGYLAGPALDLNFFIKIDPGRVDKLCIDYALHRIYDNKKCVYDPLRSLDEHYNRFKTFKRPPKQPFISLDGDLGLVYIRRVQVTPCRVIFCKPEPLVSNRIVRNFSSDIDNFIRISFVDEDMERVHSTDLCPYRGERTGIDTRIRSVLKNGIRIGDKKFEFLGFSNSQLKENSVWMFASRPGLSASDIRKWMGDFSQIRNVAKYAARLGQSLSSSKETLKVEKHEMEIIEDVEVETEGIKYVFSDGIGKISATFADEVAKKGDIKGRTPSAFQIRYAGFKGVVALDPTMPPTTKLCLRKSMLKYESENDKLDILANSKYQACFLNRQIIVLLSTLGVKDEAFERKQQEATKQLELILTDSSKALDALRLMASGEITNILKDMLGSGYEPEVEPFLSKMLQTFLASKLHELRTRTRIFVPDGRAMMGCLDETGILEYGQVFVQVSGSRDRDSMMSKDKLTRGRHSRTGFPTYVVEGQVVVAKNPCLHPGDVRVLTAVHVAALGHMVDCVVFPRKGPRPHPNECSGSDLDGDVYFVCWDPELIPPRTQNPTDYTAARATVLDHDVTIEEVQDYFVDYIINDNLGVIANAHTVFADKDPEKANSAPCVKLARLFSVAVDFPKTGVPAEIPQDLRVNEYPDFMEKPEKLTYESENVIGKLFREVRDKVPESVIVPFTKEIAKKCYDPGMEYEGFREYIEDACARKSEYDSKLGNLMDYYGIKTEGEILSGSIVRMTKRKDVDVVPLAVKSLRNEARGWFNEDEGAAKNRHAARYAKASAWYHVTYHPDYWGAYSEGTSREHFLSFPWCVHEYLIDIKKGETTSTRSRRRNR